MPGGRPNKYPTGRTLDSLQSRILELAHAGWSPAQESAEVGAPRTTLLTWAKAHPEFTATLARAKELEQAWWEDRGRAGLSEGSAFNARAWKIAMQARFPDEYIEHRRVRRSGRVRYQVTSGLEPDS